MEQQLIPEGSLLWEPSDALIDRTNAAGYINWLDERHGLKFNDYQSLWEWSVTQIETFWASIWDYFQIISHETYENVLSRSNAGKRVENAIWFQGATLNYAENALRRRDDSPAIIANHESGTTRTISFRELAKQVGAVAEGMRRYGVSKGDCVVGYLPNTIEAAIGTLAAASIGAAWSSCPPEFGTMSVIERFEQLEPKLLIAADGYTYNGKEFDRMEAVEEIRNGLPTLELTVLFPYLNSSASSPDENGIVTWEQFGVQGAELRFEAVPFNHPLWVVYSSGTTGAPKAIVHGHGGSLLEHYKAIALHLDVIADDRFFWFSTTGWIMWNINLSGLLVGACVVVYDGSPGYPDMTALWRMAEKCKVTHFGVSAPYLMSCLKADIAPGQQFDLSSMRCVGSTGAPLPPEGFAWVYQRVGNDLLMASISGGTDVLTAFVMSSPMLPIYAGEMQCRALGCKVEAFNDAGQPVIEEVGELVITEPMPSMPLYFLKDPDGSRYHESYFDTYEDVWRHGDWLKITDRGTCVIYGRSDSTLNRSGVRMGTSEFYRVIEDIPEVTDSLVIDTSQLGTEGKLLLFVVLVGDALLDGSLRERISRRVRSSLSPRHVPDAIHQIFEVPRTLNGKKLEVPIKKILNGADPVSSVSEGALANPQAIQYFVQLALSDQR